MKNLVGIFVLILFLLGCDSKLVYEKYTEIGNEGWHKDSVLVFNFEIADTVQVHNLYINIRNKGNYPNSNIWMFLAVDAPDGTCLTDTVEFTLADNTGKWLGSGIGDIFDNQFNYKSHVYFPEDGSYSFKIQHGMRTELLKGIRDVGVRVESIQ